MHPNSIFERKPIPSIYIRHYLDIEKEKSIKEVVDGQQRIRSILEYIGGEFSEKYPDIKKRLKYGDLSPTQKERFLMTSISIGYLIGANDGDVIEIFGRLNSVAKTLNAQEKRCAKYSGEVKQFSLGIATEHLNIWRGLSIFSANDIARMNEVQFVSDLAINMIKGLSDYSAPALDKFYSENDEEFAEQEDIKERMEKVFSKIAGLKQEIIKDTIFSRNPIFFSLFIVLDSIECKINADQLEYVLYKIDENFNADTPISERRKEEADFYLACTASTQRIRSRRIRDEYIKKLLQVELK